MEDTKAITIATSTPRSTKKLTYYQLGVAIGFMKQIRRFNSYTQLSSELSSHFNVDVTENELIEYFEPDYRELTEDLRLHLNALNIVYK